MVTFSIEFHQFTAPLRADLCNLWTNGIQHLFRDARVSVFGDKDKEAAAGKSSGAVARMPLVLADIWAHASKSCKPSNQPALPVGV